MTVLDLLMEYPDIALMPVSQFYIILVLALLLVEGLFGVIKWILFR